MMTINLSTTPYHNNLASKCREKVPLLLISILIPFVFALWSCGKPVTDVLPAEAKQAAQLLKSSIPDLANSSVLFVGPVPPASVVREYVVEEKEPQRLVLPESEGTYYVFFIDDHPDRKFHHPVRYAWVDTRSKRVDTVNAAFYPVIEIPGQPSRPFEQVAADSIDGVPFVFGKGEFGAEVHEVGDVPELTEKTLIQDIEPITGCVKVALVFDGGDVDRHLFNPSWTVITDLADNYAADADTMAGWLRSKGWSINRVTQYWDKVGKAGYHTIRSSAGKTMRDKYLEILQMHGKAFKALNQYAKNCCHEFFIYISAHGTENGFEIFDPSGSGVKSVVGYGDVLMQFQNHFPDNVKFTIFMDVCKSGGMINTFRAAYEPTLCKKFKNCGVTILTATDDKTDAAGGQSSNSGTQDFLEMPKFDYDKDGKKDDIRDRFTEMEIQGKGYNPQWYHCPKGTAWCSLD